MTTKSLDATKSLNDGFLGGIALAFAAGAIMGGMLAIAALVTIA
jgi:hypothetical protein